MVRQLRSYSVVVLLGLTLAVLSCGDEEGEPGATATAPPSDEAANLFPNPGFEEGSDPWFSLKEPNFIRTEAMAHSESASALLQMRDPLEAEGAKVYYLVQEIEPEEFPEVLSGFYRVENWKKETPKQYIQFVVIAFGVDNLPGAFPNHQIRYPLAGIDSPPFPIGNAHFIFLGRDEPVTGEWVPFEANIREDFLRLWGAVPEGFDKLRILFEVRWDDKEALATAEADAYFDDLYMGPASANPNRSGS